MDVLENPNARLVRVLIAYPSRLEGTTDGKENMGGSRSSWRAGAAGLTRLSDLNARALCSPVVFGNPRIVLHIAEWPSLKGFT